MTFIHGVIERDYINYYRESKIDISQYKTMIRANNSYSARKSLTQYVLETKDKEQYTIDISDLVNSLIDIKSEIGYKTEDELINQYMKENDIVKIDDRTDLYIVEMSLSYMMESREVNYLTIFGYVLEK